MSKKNDKAKPGKKPLFSAEVSAIAKTDADKILAGKKVELNIADASISTTGLAGFDTEGNVVTEAALAVTDGDKGIAGQYAQTTNADGDVIKKSLEASVDFGKTQLAVKSTGANDGDDVGESHQIKLTRDTASGSTSRSLGVTTNQSHIQSGTGTKSEFATSVFFGSGDKVKSPFLDAGTNVKGSIGFLQSNTSKSDGSGVIRYGLDVEGVFSGSIAVKGIFEHINERIKLNGELVRVSPSAEAYLSIEHDEHGHVERAALELGAGIDIDNIGEALDYQDDRTKSIEVYRRSLSDMQNEQSTLVNSLESIDSRITSLQGNLEDSSDMVLNGNSALEAELEALLVRRVDTIDELGFVQDDIDRYYNDQIERIAPVGEFHSGAEHIRSASLIEFSASGANIQIADDYLVVGSTVFVEVDGVLHVNGQAAETVPSGTFADLQREYTSLAREQDVTSDEVSYRIRDGDNLSDVATRFGVSIDEIVTANGIANADQINAGDNLIVPGLALQTEVVNWQQNLDSSLITDASYTVVSGDTVSTVMQRMGLDYHNPDQRDQFLTANGLSEPDQNGHVLIAVGDTLSMPEEFSQHPTDINNETDSASGDQASWAENIEEHLGIKLGDASALIDDEPIYIDESVVVLGDGLVLMLDEHGALAEVGRLSSDQLSELEQNIAESRSLAFDEVENSHLDGDEVTHDDLVSSDAVIRGEAAISHPSEDLSNFLSRFDGNDDGLDLQEARSSQSAAGQELHGSVIGLWRGFENDDDAATFVSAVNLLVAIDHFNQSGDAIDRISSGDSHIENNSMFGEFDNEIEGIAGVLNGALGLSNALDNGDVAGALHGAVATLDGINTIVDDSLFGEQGLSSLEIGGTSVNIGQALSVISLVSAIDGGDPVAIASAGIQVYSAFADNAIPGLGYASAVISLVDGDITGAYMSTMTTALMSAGPYGWVAAAVLTIFAGDALAETPPPPMAGLTFTDLDGEISISTTSNETGAGLESMLQSTGSGLIDYLGSLETHYSAVIDGGEIAADRLPSFHVQSTLDDGQGVAWTMRGGNGFENVTFNLNDDPDTAEIARLLHDQVLFTHRTEDWFIGSETIVDPITGEVSEERYYSPFASISVPTLVNAVAVGEWRMGGQQGPTGEVFAAEVITAASAAPIASVQQSIAQVHRTTRVDGNLFSGPQGQLIALGLATGVVSIEQVEALNAPFDETPHSLQDDAANVSLIEQFDQAYIIAGSHNTESQFIQNSEGNEQDRGQIFDQSGELSEVFVRDYSSRRPVTTASEEELQQTLTVLSRFFNSNGDSVVNGLTAEEAAFLFEEQNSSTDSVEQTDQSGVDNASGAIDNISIQPRGSAAGTSPPDNLDERGGDQETHENTDSAIGSSANSNDSIVISNRAINTAPQASLDSAKLDEDTVLRISFDDLLQNDSDSEDDRLSIAGVGDALNGTVQLDMANREVVFIPHLNFNGVAEFFYQVDDGNGGSDIGQVSLEVAAVNDTPDLHNDSAGTLEDTSITITLPQILVNDIDVDGDRLNLTRVFAAADGEVEWFDNGTAELIDDVIRFTPDQNFNGVASFSYEVSDGVQLQTASVNIEVASVNDAPIALARLASQTDEDTSLNLSFDQLLSQIVDVEGGVEVISVRTQDGVVSIDQNSRTLSFTPLENANSQNGESALIEYTVSDDHGALVSNQISVNVSPINDNPSVQSDLVFAWQAGSSNYVSYIDTADLLSNDFDVDGDQIELSSVSSLSGAQVDVVEGRVMYTAPADTRSNQDSFNYSVVDANGGSAQAEVRVQLIENTAPFANDFVTQADEDTILKFDWEDFIQHTDDVDQNHTELNEELRLVSVGSAQQGQVSMQDGHVVFTPNAHFNSAEGVSASFEYTVQDIVGNQSTATGLINYAAVNDEVNARADDLGVLLEDNILQFTASQLLANDVDADGDAYLSEIRVASGAGGSIAHVGGGSYQFIPNNNANGATVLQYTIADGIHSSTSTAQIHVEAVNDAPSIRSIGGVSGNEDVSNRIRNVLSTGSANDADGDRLSLQVIASSGGISARVSGNDIIWIDNTPGSGTISYRVSDGSTTSATATVQVTTLDVAEPPRNLHIKSFSRNSDGKTASGIILAVDPDGPDSDIRYALSRDSGPGTGSFEIDARTGFFTWSFNDRLGSEGVEASITVRATDGQGNSTDRSYSLGSDGSLHGAPVVIDLNRDGLNLSAALSGVAQFDWDDSGVSNQTGWIAGEGDAVLVYDHDDDGQVSHSNEVSFVSYLAGAVTDLEGLRAFDSNGDGLISANDDQWEEFALWTDDGDAVSEAGELTSLGVAGIESISLASDQQSIDINGNLVHGFAEVRMSDGSIVQAGDVSFSFLAAEVVESEEAVDIGVVDASEPNVAETLQSDRDEEQGSELNSSVADNEFIDDHADIENSLSADVDDGLENDLENSLENEYTDHENLNTESSMSGSEALEVETVADADGLTVELDEDIDNQLEESGDESDDSIAAEGAVSVDGSSSAEGSSSADGSASVEGSLSAEDFQSAEDSLSAEGSQPGEGSTQSNDVSDSSEASDEQATDALPSEEELDRMAAQDSSDAAAMDSSTEVAALSDDPEAASVDVDTAEQSAVVAGG